MTCAVCKTYPKRDYPRGSSGQCVDDLTRRGIYDARCLAAAVIRQEAARLAVERRRFAVTPGAAGLGPFALATPGYIPQVTLQELEAIAAALEATPAEHPESL